MLGVVGVVVLREKCVMNGFRFIPVSNHALVSSSSKTTSK